jgi:hypothetical protein
VFTATNLQTLLSARPFVPFRLVLSDGGSVEVKSQELVMIGRHFAVVGRSQQPARRARRVHRRSRFSGSNRSAQAPSAALNGGSGGWR